MFILRKCVALLIYFSTITYMYFHQGLKNLDISKKWYIIIFKKKFKVETFCLLVYGNIVIVATLTMGLWPGQGLARLWAKIEAWESHLMLPRVQESVRGMNLHTLKWTLILGVEVPMDSQIFRRRLQGSKPIGLKSSLYHWKVIEM